MNKQDKQNLSNFKRYLEDDIHKMCNLFDMIARIDQKEAEKSFKQAIEKLTKKLNDSKK